MQFYHTQKIAVSLHDKTFYIVKLWTKLKFMFSLSYLFNKLLNKLGISPWKKQDQKEHNTIAVISFIIPFHKRHTYKHESHNSFIEWIVYARIPIKGN